jgi:hypothetical protein
VTATTQEEVLSGILPKVNINKITLTSPDERILNVSLDLTIKETLDDGFFGSWFEDININKYILVEIVQSTDAAVTEALSYSNDMIQLCNLQRQLKIDDTRTKALAYITQNNKVSDLLALLEDKTKRETISINKSETKITENIAYTNSDGDKIYEIPYKVQFSLDKQPEHLAYFAVCSIDLDALCADLNIDYDVAESFEENGRVVSEIVIDEFNVVSETYVYVDKNGVVWTGPVHETEQGLWRSGDDETSESINLDRILVTNTKVQDFRRFNRIERLMVDFNNVNSRYVDGSLVQDFSLLTETTANNITKIQSVDYKPDRYTAQFTEAFSSTDANGNYKFLFGVNFLEVLKSHSRFAKLFETNSDTFKEESIQNTRILDLKLYRTRIKNADSKPYEKLNPEEPDELILQTKDISWKNFININNDLSAIKEADILTNNTNNFIRYFTGIDKTFKNLSDGVYQYKIDFEIEDGVVEFIQDKLSQLEIAKKQLVEYSNKISKPTMRKFIVDNTNPHIESPSEYSQNSLVMDYGYDIVTNKLSPQLISKTIREYGGITSITAPWNTCSATLAYILDIFSSEISTEQDREEIVRSIFDMLSPNSTNPQIVARAIEMIDYFITNISKTFDITVGDNSFASNTTSTISSKTNKTFKTTKVLEGVGDTSISKSFGIDYLSNTTSQPTGEEGLLVLSSQHMLTRTQNEMSKFFTTQDPNISFSNTGDNFQDLKYSYFTPTRIDFPNKTTVLSRLDNDNSQGNTRSIDYFYENANNFTKAVSLQADIINFKLDVGGKNRFLPETKKQSSQEQLTPAQRRGQALEQKDISINKMKQVLAEYSSTTFMGYSVSQEVNVEGQQNITQLERFMSSLSSDALRLKQTFGYKKSKNSSTFVPNYVEEDYIRNLSELNPNSIRISNDRITGFRKVFPVSLLGNVPNQLRAIIFKPQELQVDIASSITNTNNTYSINVVNKAKNYFHFEMIAQIEYLEGFDTTQSSSDQSTMNPVWKTLTKSYIDNVQREKEILCRIRSFGNANIGIKTNAEVENRSYDKYFIIRTTTLRAQRPVNPFDDNPLVNRFIDTIKINIPGIQIKESSDITRRLVTSAPSIQIIKTDTTGRRQVVEVKDIRDAVARDISVVQNTKVGDTRTPASVTAAVNVISLAFQGANISNNVRSSNFVPNTNIKTAGRRV